MDDNVLPSILRRTPVTAELTFYSLLLFIPLGIISGVIAGSRSGKASDFRFRLAAFIATSLPTFVLAIILMAVFYVFLRWFPPERLSIANSVFVKSANFHSYTGFMTIDGFLNKRADISLDAARHLVLPVITLSLLHWATLGRVTRATMIEEVEKDYFMAAKARGVKEKGLIWKHAFRNVLSPALTSTALSAAALFTGVFVVEVLFNLKGVSSLVVIGARGVPDAPLILGFGVYSVVVVLLLMFFLDIIQAFIDPRL
jgi:peptide/nickel transport system permease protein